jgi:hypothetical protein
MAGPAEIVGGFAEGAREIASNPGGAMAGVFDIGEASGTDHGSSNWAAWGHEEIRKMLDTTVHPGVIGEGARLWRALRESAEDIIKRSTAELRGIVADGWRGEAADAAIRSLGPVGDWTDSVSAAMDRTAQLMDDSGYYAGQAKATVPQPQPHDWKRSLGSFALGGGVGAFVDAVAQDRAQEEARAEAVRIMTNVYSVPINDNRAAVPVYPQLADPTLRPAEPSPVSGPSPGSGPAGPGVSAAGGGAPAGSAAHLPPTPASLQGASSRAGFPDSGLPTPGHGGGAGQPGGSGGGPGGGGFGGAGPGAGAAAAAGAPFLAPIGGTGGDAERAWRGFRGAGVGHGRPGGVEGRAGGGAGAGGGSSFGPRGSGGASAAESRGGAAPSSGAGGAAGRGGAGVAPVAGAGRGSGGEDTEHRRPSYLIEMNDIFGDGRKVAPPVIGEDPPEHYG